MAHPRRLAVCGSFLLAAAAAAQTPSFDLLGEAAWIYEEGPRVLLSADGRTVAAGDWVWTREDGSRTITAEPGSPDHVQITAMSRDGRTLAGSWSVGRNRAFRYRGVGTFEHLGTTFGSAAYVPLSLSDDGTTLCGYERQYDMGNFRDLSVIWTGTPEPHHLDERNYGLLFSEARSLTADGSTLAGFSIFQEGAWLWSQAGGARPLASPFPDGSRLQAEAISADGRVVAGTTHVGRAVRGVVWHDGVPMAIAPPGLEESIFARAVSDDGSVICFGTSRFSSWSAWGAAVWNGGTTMIPLADYLRGAGVDLPAGWEIIDCTGISGDGRTFAGAMRSEDGTFRAFIATVPEPGALLVLLAAPVLSRRRRV